MGTARKESAAAEAAQPKSRIRRAWEGIRSIAVALLVALAVRAFLFEPYSIPSGSMLPTLQIGDYVVVTKFAYGIRLPFTNTMLWQRGLPKRGDVIVFERPTAVPETLIKRVVGLPGETVEIIDGVLHVDGVPQPRTLLQPGYAFDDYLESTRTWVSATADLYVEAFPRGEGEARHLVLQARHLRRYREGPYRVPEGHVLVFGDNRDNSTDSRSFGAVPLGNIRGRADLVGFSWGKRGPRLDRFFHRIDGDVPAG